MRVFLRAVLAGFLVLVWTAVAVTGQDLVLDVTSPWTYGTGGEPETDQYEVETLAESYRITVHQPAHAVTRNFAGLLMIDPERTPVLSMTYRARGLDMRRPELPLLAFWGGQPDNMTTVSYKDIVSDGRRQTVRVDLREILERHDASAEALVYLDLRIHADGDAETPSDFEVFDLRFLADGPFGEGERQEVESRPVRVKAVDEKGRPVAGARVVLDGHLKDYAVTATTDAEGMAVVYPARSELVATRSMVELEREGRASVIFRDLREVGDDRVLTARLLRVQRLSGRVEDESGMPVAGAMGEVWLHVDASTDRRVGWPRFQMSKRVLSDASGHWQSEPLPVLGEEKVLIAWKDGRYLVDQWGGQYSGAATLEQLLDGTAVSVLKRGVAQAGVVRDEAGRPIGGALVATGSDRFASNSPPSTVTDDSGRYRFDNLPEGLTVFTVSSEGHAPELVQVGVEPGAEPLDFTLKPAAVFRIQTVNEEGEPIRAYISPDEWRGFRTIPERLETGEDGVAVYYGPHDEVAFDFFAEDVGDVRGLRLSPNPEGPPHRVVFKAPLTIEVRVTDAETGEPVRTYRAIPGLKFQDHPAQSIHWEHHSVTDVDDERGEAELVFGYPYPFRFVMIESPGYGGVISRAIEEKHGRVSLAFALSPAPDVRYRLADAQGVAEAGMRVYLTTMPYQPYLRNGRVSHSERPYAETDDAGWFSFPPQAQPFALVVAEEAGYLHVLAEDLPEVGEVLRLRPWARVKGRVLVGDSPRDGESVMISVVQPPMVPNVAQDPGPQHQYKVKADEAGYFLADRVPPASIQVGRRVTLSDNAWTSTLNQNFEPEPGETIEVLIGGSGRNLRGTFVWPGDSVPRAPFASVQARLSTWVDPEPMKAVISEMMPEGYEDWTQEERSAFFATEEGTALQERTRELQMEMRSASRHHVFRVESDGSFVIHNVESGTYELEFKAHEPPEGDVCGFGEPTAKFTQRVTVPAFNEGVTYVPEPLELGLMRVDLIQPSLQEGDVAHDFTVPLMDPEAEDPLAGEASFTLSDHRGKVVLIDFWATWCGPCLDETPNLKAVWERHGSDPNFTMIGLSLDDQPKAPAAYAQKQSLGWHQGFLGAWNAATLPEDYGVRGIPSIWLIGPDGRVLVKGLRGDRITQAVTEALSRMPDAVTRAD
ncbi:carboxypeptidase regulatory-like domain-containing protein [Mucisphaera calidilacus]|uniref:Thiol:disulfide interchange protein CycY n=1 Tax=Mucisphaera calidilacus TaxID=2527982 RepID=A0A518BZZ5_9BACT|nr:carboxypeptidase regulatory-like domain-containing protein [Mucisphaera calidilacus]QDU72544.1 Thiol:disulfide interchange protein CycY precursor [Mucisphaera calidilacus]